MSQPEAAPTGHHDDDATQESRTVLIDTDGDIKTNLEEADGTPSAVTAPTEPPTGDADETEDHDRARSGTKLRRSASWSRILAYGILPAMALVLGLAAGFLKWEDFSVRDADTARREASQAARDSTIALLSYRPETVEHDLGAARDRLTGQFRDSYTQLTTDVVIPGAKQKQISAAASVPATASVSATADHAVVLLFVNQTVVVGSSAPTDTASSVRVTLDKVGDRWLISGFDPV